MACSEVAPAFQALPPAFLVMVVPLTVTFCALVHITAWQVTGSDVGVAVGLPGFVAVEVLVLVVVLIGVDVFV